MAKRATKTSSPPGHGKDDPEAVAGIPAAGPVETAADGSRWRWPDVLRPLLVPLERLRSDPRNARAHDERSYEAIRASLRKFGQRKVIVVDADGVVVAGNGQLEAARREGWTHLAVADTSGMTAEDVRAFALADNRTAELSAWDFTALHVEMEALADAGLQLVDLGWTPAEVKDIADDLTKAKNLKDVDHIPSTPATPTTVLGDVWVMGEHRLVCGSASDRAAWLRLMDGGRAKMVWTDPPYGVSYVGKTKGALVIENDALDPAALRRFLAETLGLAAEFCEAGAAWYVAAPSGDLFLEFAHVLGREGLGIWRHTLAWVKDRFVMGRADYHYRHESIFYGWVPGAGHYFVDDRTLDTVLEVPRPARNADHPTMKPVELVARNIRSSSKPGWIVVDPFGGSGTTLLACEQENRAARLIELSPAYCDVIVRRWEQATGQKATRIATP